MDLNQLTRKVLDGEQITKEEALFLYEQPLLELCEKANQIRQYFCANKFDICTIINAKSGKCSENCKYCAQSAHNHTSAATYPLLSKQEIVDQAKVDHEQGVLRYSIVTSGKRLSDAEIDALISSLLMKFVHTKKSVADLYISLIGALLIGRVIAGVVKALIFARGEITITAWATSYFVTCLPGIIMQIILVPVIYASLVKANLIPSRYVYKEE